ncbi:MAG: hypothetical protein L5655_12285, partial [Thermosediminibacteraceae bacterium]|nr:hypothetical protein [Thermosediminibacteraceae bacterium]
KKSTAMSMTGMYLFLIQGTSLKIFLRRRRLKLCICNNRTNPKRTLLLAIMDIKWENGTPESRF